MAASSSSFCRCDDLRDVLGGAAHLDARVVADHAQAAAGRVQQHPVHAAADVLADPPPVAARDDRVVHAHAVQVARQRLEARGVDVVGDEQTLVLHQRREVRGLAARAGGHVQHALARLRGQSHHGKEGGGGLQNVVPGQVLGRGAYGYLTVVHLQTHLGPPEHNQQTEPITCCEDRSARKRWDSHRTSVLACLVCAQLPHTSSDVTLLG